jgi:hypothetical protein
VRAPPRSPPRHAGPPGSRGPWATTRSGPRAARTARTDGAKMNTPRSRSVRTGALYSRARVGRARIAASVSLRGTRVAHGILAHSPRTRAPMPGADAGLTPLRRRPRLCC